MVVQVPQVDEEDEPTGFSTNSSVVTRWPPNKDEGDMDNNHLELADLLRRGGAILCQTWRRERHEIRMSRRLRVKDKDDHVANNDDSESDDADYNLLVSDDDDDDQPKE
jgi:hypothetical protein|uniref:Uncharacterized protein n=1 Tax=Fagus sylvatica TaxID=28930 RepID=A0A2N9F835_FAGSY